MSEDKNPASEEPIENSGASDSDSTETPNAQADSEEAASTAATQESADELGGLEKELELVKDLQRLQAEFVNYKNRVERDRELSRTSAIAEVLRSLLPALDDLARAEAHGDLEGSPFAAVATKLRAAGEKFGLSSFGAKGDKFDPEFHEALIQTPSADVTENTVADVVEPGYLLGDRLVRAAKVAVFIPAE